MTCIEALGSMHAGSVLHGISSASNPAALEMTGTLTVFNRYMAFACSDEFQACQTSSPPAGSTRHSAGDHLSLQMLSKQLMPAASPAQRHPAVPRIISCSRRRPAVAHSAANQRGSQGGTPAAAVPKAAGAEAATTAAGSRRNVLIGSLLASTAAAADQVLAEEEQAGPPAEQAPGNVEAGAPAAAGSNGSSSSSKQGSRPRKKPLRRRQAAAQKQPGAVPRVKLGGGLEVSQIIRGCWQLDGQHRGDPLSDRTTGAAAIQDLDEFCKHGIFTLDTADNYGPSEAIIGQHMRLNPGAAARTKVLTKLSFMNPPSAAELRKDAIEYRVRSSIARLGVTTLDMVQLHWEPAAAVQQQPARGKGSGSPPGFVTAARALQQLQAEGVVRHVGVTNFDVPMLMALADAGITPASNQVSYSVLDRRPALFLSRFCEARGIPLLCYGALAGGLLAERYRDVPANTVRIDTASKARYGGLLKQLGGWALAQDVLACLGDVAARHGVSVSCVAARWVLQQPGVAALVVGARNASHIRDLQRLWSFELDEIDMLDIDAAYEGAEQPTTDVYVWERGGDW